MAACKHKAVCQKKRDTLVNVVNVVNLPNITCHKAKFGTEGGRNRHGRPTTGGIAGRMGGLQARMASL